MDPRPVQVTVVNKIYVVQFDADTIYWPKYWDQALDDETGELIPLSEFEAPSMFGQHLWDSITNLKTYTGGVGDVYELEVEADSWETEDSVRDLVEDCVNEWNEVAAKTEKETLEWYDEIKNGRDPLDIGEFDVMI
jgi:hypothetical protein